jgi:hypothetical protein
MAVICAHYKSANNVRAFRRFARFQALVKPTPEVVRRACARHREQSLAPQAASHRRPAASRALLRAGVAGAGICARAFITAALPAG